MKLDLILENVRNSYTLNLLEESSTHGVDEREVIKGKMLINESTMMVRRILVEEGLMQNVKVLLENTFAQIIEESIFGDWEPASEEQIMNNSAAENTTNKFSSAIGQNNTSIGNYLAPVGQAIKNGFGYMNNGQFNQDAHNAINATKENIEAKANGVAYKNASINLARENAELAREKAELARENAETESKGLAYKNSADGLVGTVSQPGAQAGIVADGLAQRYNVPVTAMAGAAGAGALGAGALLGRFSRRPVLARR